MTTNRTPTLITGLRVGLVIGLFLAERAGAFPNVCSVVRTPEFNSCLDFQVGACVCRFRFHIRARALRTTFRSRLLRSCRDPKDTVFSALPGAAFQLATHGCTAPLRAKVIRIPSLFTHVLPVPFTGIPFSLLPCSAEAFELTCLRP